MQVVAERVLGRRFIDAQFTRAASGVKPLDAAAFMPAAQPSSVSRTDTCRRGIGSDLHTAIVGSGVMRESGRR